MLVILFYFKPFFLFFKPFFSAGAANAEHSSAASNSNGPQYQTVCEKFGDSCHYSPRR